MGKAMPRNKKTGRTREQRKAVRDKRAERQKDKRKLRAKLRETHYEKRRAHREEMGLRSPAPTAPRDTFKASLENPTYMKKLRKTILHGTSGGDWYRG